MIRLIAAATTSATTTATASAATITAASRRVLWCAALLGAALPAAQAADDTTPAPAAASQAVPADGQTPPPASMPAPNPAAEKALNQRFQAIFSAFEGKGAVPDSKAFSEDFNKQVTPEQIKEVLQQVRQGVGSCRVGGQMRSPSPYVTSYLLQCEKAFVPMDIAIEEKAPYRVHSLLIRPAYLKK